MSSEHFRRNNVKLIVGLGNPGKQYETTKHNIGFLVLDALAANLGLSFNKTKFKSIYAEGNIGTEKVILVKPQTFMNLSGESVRPWMDYFDLTEEDVVIIYDDMDLPVGKIRLRIQGGHGGHNGVKSLIQHMGTKNFNRIRVGVGRPFPSQDVVSHVLSPFSKDTVDDMKSSIHESVDAIKYWVNDKTFLETMNEFN